MQLRRGCDRITTSGSNYSYFSGRVKRNDDLVRSAIPPTSDGNARPTRPEATPPDEQPGETQGFAAIYFAAGGWR